MDERAPEIIVILLEPFIQHRVALPRADLHPRAAGIGHRIVDRRHTVIEVLEDCGGLRDFARDVMLHELAEVRGPLGLPLERDLYFAPTRTLAAYAEQAREHRRIVT